MKGHHVHNMVPDKMPKPSVYKCSSCAFRCTPAAVGEVRRSSSVHILVRAGDAQATKPWDGARR